MTGVARITKLDFFIMKSQGISYLSLVAVILLFGLMGSSITVLCITGAWFIALLTFLPYRKKIILTVYMVLFA